MNLRQIAYSTVVMALVFAGAPGALADLAPFDLDLLGEKIGELTEDHVNLDLESGPVELRASMRGVIYVGIMATDESTAPDMFEGSGESFEDMIQATQSDPIPPALRRYLNRLDPGGRTVLVEFYEDLEGCETDIVTRQGPDGTVRRFLVDSTGWIDRMLQVAQQPVERSCTR